MKAAVVSSFERVPAFGEFQEPMAEAGEVVVEVRAAGLSRLVEAQAAGKHYSSGGELPFVPGVDGVGRTEDGRRVYFAFPRAPFGSMAERTVVRPEMCVEVPEGVDDVLAAAIANPGMSSWVALTERARMVAGETVLIHGATGVSGRLAIGIAKALGAGRVVATGRNASSVEGLGELGADAVIALDQPKKQLTKVFRDAVHEGGVSVVLDYLWGPTAEMLLSAMGGHGGGEAEPRVRYVQIGSVAGATMEMNAGWLRSSGVELLGSGLGSVSNERLVMRIGEMLGAGLRVEAVAVPLGDVERVWGKGTGERVVFTV